MSQPFAVSRRPRITLIGILITAVAALTIGGLPAAANAAPPNPTTASALQDALAGTETTVTLGGQILDGTVDLVVSRDLTLDLGGHSLTTKSLTIAAGHTVTIIASSGYNVFTTIVEGTLTLGTNLTVPSNSTIAVGANGTISSDDPSRTLTAPGTGSITNAGIIAVTIPDPGSVTGTKHMVRLIYNVPSGQFEDSYIYAPSFAAAGMNFPFFMRGVHMPFNGWNSKEDGTGTSLTTSTPLSGIAYGAQYYAQWTSDGITSIAVSYADSPSARAGSIALTATDTSPGGGDDITDLVNFSSSNPADSVDVSGNFSKSLVAESAGTRVVTATLKGSPSVKNTATVTVIHSANVAAVDLTISPTTVPAGKASAAYLSATDQYGNSFGYNLLDSSALDCDSCQVDLTSSEPTDVIDQDTGVITFTTVGAHTITVTVQRIESDPFTATATVTVTAAPVTPAEAAPPKALAVTGYEPTPTPWIAALLLLAGLGSLLVARRRRA